MKKRLSIDGYRAWAEVREVKEGYDIVIKIPFLTEYQANFSLSQLSILREVKDETKKSSSKGS